ncbi:autotransporter outer membrane beta-barrel domain-containing protein [Achromobacter mucicolens]|uniref:autotransporter outer membrane beta-barrel domain-containing protein n=1 Tax=Achromobacter mucicolens TaxID=1389922 RepID=UPI0026478ADE|nr:autotransporter outer membrane beta-barrel domain-containing protein [Achromobacter mucicolens]
MNVDSRAALRRADSTPFLKTRTNTIKLCVGLLLLSVDVPHPAVAAGGIVGVSGAGGQGGASNGGRGGDGGDGHAALDLTTSYTTAGDVEGGAGGGGGGGGGGGHGHSMGGAGGAGGNGGAGIVISGDAVVLHNDGWSIRGGKGGGGGGGGGSTFHFSVEADGGRGGDGSTGAGGAAGGGGGGGAYIRTGFGGDGGHGGEDGLVGGGGPLGVSWAGGGGGGGGSSINGGSAGQDVWPVLSEGVGGPGGTAGGASGVNGDDAQPYEGFAPGGGGGGAPGGAGGDGGQYTRLDLNGGGGAGSSNHAVYVTGADSVIINSGAIMAGPVNQNTAIKYAGTASNATLMLREGSVIQGLVDATESAGTNTLVLDGGAALAFDVGKIGNGAQGQYLGFNAFEKTSDGMWALTGSPSLALTPWTLLGGWLAITDDAALGDVAGGLVFDGGGLQLNASMSSQRDFQLRGDGAVHTAGGTVSVMQGTISGAGSLTKTGSGTWIILGSDSGSGNTTQAGPLTHTGVTRVDEGMLVIHGTALGQADHAAASVAGASNATLSLANGGRLDGQMDGPNLIIDATSRWNVLADAATAAQDINLSRVNALQLAGSIAFSPPSEAANNQAGRTFTANNLVGAGGEVQLHVNPTGAADHLTLTQGATGLTYLKLITPGGFGDPLAGDGLLVVKAGASTDHAFLQTPGQPTQAGAFNYGLVQGARSGAADLANNWYLFSDIRPEVSIYSQLGNQALRQSEVAVGSFNERMGATETLARTVYPYVWARSLGVLERRDGAPLGIRQANVAVDSRLGGLQVGTDLFVASKGIGRQSVGVFGTAMVSRNDVSHYQASTRSTVDAGRSDQTLYGLGAYYTLMDGKGGYADFVGQVSRYGVKTQSRGAHGTSLQTSGWGAALSAEAGKAFDIRDGRGLRVEPQAQVMVQHVKLRDAEDSVGRVALPGLNALHSRVSLKLSKVWGEQAQTQSHGWLMLSYRHTLGSSSSSYPTATQGDIEFDNDLDGSRVGLAAGYDRRAGRNTFVNVRVQAEQGLGSASGLRAVAGSVGVKYLF